jgi:4-aminobutyrate aminotransferase/(S)-3-amino-2-methylpropionate transaminase
MFACEHEGIVPDIIITAKGIAGGLPLSAITGRAEIMDAPHAGGLGGTYAGNPLACAAALAAIRSFEEDGLIERAGQLGTILLDKLGALQKADPRIGDLRGRGAMIAIELVDPATGEPDSGLASRIATAAYTAGVIVLICGTYGNVIRFLPPLSISDELMIEGLQVVADAVAAS